MDGVLRTVFEHLPLRKKYITINEKVVVGVTKGIPTTSSCRTTLRGAIHSDDNVDSAPWRCAVKKSYKITDTLREIFLKEN